VGLTTTTTRSRNQLQILATSAGTEACHPDESINHQQPCPHGAPKHGCTTQRPVLINGRRWLRRP